MTYYNEHDLYAADWLRNLIRDGLIPGGDVDTRDIQKVQPDDVKHYRQVHLFAGIGGWPLALRFAGWPDDRPVWSGSCPCQSFSAAGKAGGHGDSRNLWPEMLRLIRECRPAKVVGEQVESAIRFGWLDGVLCDLEELSYACGAAVLPAAGVGASHIRSRIYWCADTEDGGHGEHKRNGRTVGSPTGGGTGEESESGRSAQTSRDSRPDAHAGPNAQRDGGRIDEQERGQEGRTADRRDIQASANTEDSKRRRMHNGKEHQPQTQARRCRDADGGSQHATVHRRQQWRAESGGRRAACGCRDDDGNGNAVESRLEGLGGGKCASESPAGATGAWDDFYVVACRDIDKRTGRPALRRVGRGVQPLAPGIPLRVGPLIARMEQLGIDPKDARRIVREARRNRNGRLKGYGNALCVQVAVEFTRAFMEVAP